MKKLLMMVGLLSVAVCMGATPKVAWDLAKDAGDLSKELKKNGFIPFTASRAFEVPQVIKNHSVFTAQITLKFTKTPEEKTRINLFNQMTADTGWKFSILNFGGVGSPMTLVVNGVTYNVGWFRAKAGDVQTYTIAARKGLVTVYKDKTPLKNFFTVTTPNLEPIKIGGEITERDGTEMEGVQLLGLKFFGPEVEFYQPGEKRDFANGFKGGKGWMVEVPAVEKKNMPRILYYGDSISAGYTGYLKKNIAGKAYGYHWCGFNGNANGIHEQAFAEVAKLAKYNMIVFNNGLHSLHWTEDKVSDEMIKDNYRAMVKVFRENAPQAKLVYLMTTPHTARKDASGKVSGFGDLNNVVQRLNRLAKEVMTEEKVDILDGYAMLKDKLELAAGDGYHWQGPAYEILANAIAAKLFNKKLKKSK